MGVYKTNAQFIRDVLNVHGDALRPVDIYISAHTKIKFECQKGHCWVTEPNTVLRGFGCPECSGNALKTNERFIAEVLKIHGDSLCPSETYVSAQTKITFLCSKGHPDWMAKPIKILRGSGCPECAGTILKRDGAFVEEVRNVHGDSLHPVEPYINALTKIMFRCNRGHPDWMSAPHNVLRGSGCPSCGPGGFRSNAPALLYYLRVSPRLSGQTLYKTGVTNNSVQRRFCPQDLSIIDVIDVKYFENGSNAAIEEARIKKAFKGFRYRGPRILLSAGDSELFTKDVLKLDQDLFQLNRSILDAELA
jgi:hypothetical protein